MQRSSVLRGSKSVIYSDCLLLLHSILIIAYELGVSEFHRFSVKVESNLMGWMKMRCSLEIII